MPNSSGLGSTSAIFQPYLASQINDVVGKNSGTKINQQIKMMHPNTNPISPKNSVPSIGQKKGSIEFKDSEMAKVIKETQKRKIFEVNDIKHHLEELTEDEEEIKKKSPRA